MTPLERGLTPSGHRLWSSARDLRQLAETTERVAHVEQQSQPIPAHGSVLGDHEHVLEEAVEQRPELRGRLDRRAEVAGVEGRRDLRVDALERLGDVDLGLLE